MTSLPSVINLYALILDTNNDFKYNVISTDKDKLILPNIIIEPFLDINKSLNYLLGKYIETNMIVTTDYRLSDIIIEDTVNIFYYCFITYETTTKSCYLHNPLSYEKIYQIYKKLFSFLSSIIYKNNYKPEIILDKNNRDIIEQDHIGSITFLLTKDYDIDVKYMLPNIDNISLERLLELSEKYASLLLVVNDGQMEERILEILKDSIKLDDSYSLYIENVLTFYPLLEEEFKKLVIKKSQEYGPLIRPSSVFK